VGDDGLSERHVEVGDEQAQHGRGAGHDHEQRPPRRGIGPQIGPVRRGLFSRTPTVAVTYAVFRPVNGVQGVAGSNPVVPTNFLAVTTDVATAGPSPSRPRSRRW
jgi:hypothetical protein